MLKVKDLADLINDEWHLQLKSINSRFLAEVKGKHFIDNPIGYRGEEWEWLWDYYKRKIVDRLKDA